MSRFSRGAGAAGTPVFTSTLSAKEYALAQLGGLVPVAQVMGAAVVKSNWESFAVNGKWIRPGEVSPLSGAWNEARKRAFSRLSGEAVQAGADGVIGVSAKWAETALDQTFEAPAGRAIELVVLGTAVRDHAFPRTPSRRERPALSTLSGQEVDELRRIGAEPAGVVGHTTVWSVRLGPGSSAAMFTSMRTGWSPRRAGSPRSFDLPEVAQALSTARHRAMNEVRKQARAVGANQIVVSELRHHVDRHQLTATGPGTPAAASAVTVFYVTLHVLGTAVKLAAHPPHPAPLGHPRLTVDLSG